MNPHEFDPASPQPRDLFVPSRLCAWLLRQLGGARAGHATPRRARVERCWPARGGLRFQWTYLWPGRRGRRSLFGVPTRATERMEAPEIAEWCDGEPSVRRHVETLDLLVHTPDRDADLPQVATLLNTDGLRAFVRSCLPREDAPLRVSLLGYKPGRRAAVRIETRTGRRWRTLGVAKTGQAGARNYEATATRGTGQEGTGNGLAAGRSSACSVGPPHPTRCDPLTRDVLRPGEGGWPASTEPVAQATEPSLEPPRSRSSPPLARWHSELAAQLVSRTAGRIAVPRVIGEIPELRAVLIEWVEGRRLGAGATLGADELRATAEALAAFHTLEAPAGAPPFSRSDELAVLDRWVGALRRVRPRKAAGACRLLDALAEAGERIDVEPAVLLHRDFYEKQLVWSEDRTTILDLDTLAVGEAALDVGNLIAHAALYQMTRRQAPVSMAELQDLSDAVLRAYRAGGGTVRGPLVWWYAASSMARGGALHGLRTLTRRVSPWMWALSEALLERIGRQDKALTAVGP